MTPRVEVFSASEAEWDACVLATPGWTHFQQWRWKPVIEGVFGHDCVYLAARDGAGRVTGVLPLVHARSLVFGDYLISMPFLNYGGPLGDADSVRALVAAAVEIARARKADRATLEHAIEVFSELEVDLRGGGELQLDEDTAFSLALAKAAA